MNITKDSLNKVMEQIHTDRDIVTSAKIRAEASGRGKTVKLRPIAAVLCAFMLMCGVTVSAVTLGWTEQLFGESAEIITENIDNYNVEIGNVTIENAEGVSCKFTVGDVISDGSSLYISLLIDGLDIENKKYIPLCANKISYQSGTGQKYRLLDSDCCLLDKDGNAYAFISPDCGINKNDKVEFNISDATEPNGYVKPLVRISFEICGDVTDMSKTIDICQTTEFTDSYHFGKNFEPYKGELFVETLKISPLQYTIKGKLENYENYGSEFSSPENIYHIFKNGEKTAFDPTGCNVEWDAADKSGYVIIKKHYDTVLDLDTVEAIEIGGVTVDI